MIGLTGMHPGEIGLDFVAVRGGTVVGVELDGEVVLYDESSQSIHRLNPTASIVWACLDGAATVGELIDDIAATFNVTAEDVAADVLDLARQLGRLGLLDGVDGGTEGPTGRPMPPGLGKLGKAGL